MLSANCFSRSLASVSTELQTFFCSFHLGARYGFEPQFTSSFSVDGSPVSFPKLHAAAGQLAIRAASFQNPAGALEQLVPQNAVNLDLAWIVGGEMTDSECLFHGSILVRSAKLKARAHLPYEGTISSCYGMSETPKVVPIIRVRYRMLAEDTQSRRFILGVGKHRFAFDFTSRVTRLPDRTEDAPAPVLPRKSKKRERTE
jgi:hypothetical protein